MTAGGRSRATIPESGPVVEKKGLETLVLWQGLDKRRPGKPGRPLALFAHNFAGSLHFLGCMQPAGAPVRAWLKPQAGLILPVNDHPGPRTGEAFFKAHPERLSL
ncbi:hypothetical protein CAY53_11570 [Desulfobulbus oralis]|uniref:Uncharacterized protein n=1 Tax=Desulfobulbus oralis TaxID=1986146 RepID=A0A2L1GQS4_9BACT|nr:hypothetical protein CAY53_11570 [Desulfobulbus oralis]